MRPLEQKAAWWEQKKLPMHLKCRAREAYWGMQGMAVPMHVPNRMATERRTSETKNPNKLQEYWLLLFAAKGKFPQLQQERRYQNELWAMKKDKHKLAVPFK